MKKFLLSSFFVVALIPVNVVLASSADHLLYFNKPAKVWEKGGLPIGNGSLGGVLFGGVKKAVIQFNVDSLWTGNENAKGGYNQTGEGDVFGAYQNFGQLIFEQSGAGEVKSIEGYRRQLDIEKALV